MVAFARTGAEPLHHLESALLGFTHAEVGALLLRAWGLPEDVCAAVEAHHDPLPAAEPIAAALQLAHRIVQAGDRGGADPVDAKGSLPLDHFIGVAGLDPALLPRWHASAR